MNKHLTAISFFFAASLALAGCGGTKGASSASSLASSTTSSTTSTASTPTSDGATLAAAKTIAANATRDGATCDAASLLSACSYSGKETLTKTRAFNLLYQAYHAAMPEMVGQRKYGAYVIAIPLTNVPSEAETAVKFLSDHGILVKETTAAGAVINEFNGDEDFTDGLGRYIDRFHAYFGTSLHDDFANKINHDYLYANPDTANIEPTASFEDTHLVSQTAINSWVSAHIKSMAEGDNKANVLTYQTSLSDETLKGANECAGAYTSYETLTNPTDYSGLFSTCANLFSKQGLDPLFSRMTFDGSMSLLDVPFGELDVPFDASYAQSDFASGSDRYNAFVNDANAVFTAVGFSSALADDYSKAMGQFVLSAATVYKNYVAQGAADGKTYVYSALETGPAKFVFQSHIDAAGLSALTPVDASAADPQTVGKPLARFICDHAIAYQAYFEAMTDENFAGAKAMVLYNQINAFLPCNPLTAVTHMGMSSNYLETKGILRDYLVSQVGNGVLTDYKETASYRNNVSLISKAITDLRQALRTRIAGETWLSDAGKKASLAKVEAIKTSILASNDNATAVDLSMPKFTTSLYQNISQSYLNHWAVVKTHTTSTFYGDRDLENHFTANAFYVPQRNGIIILAGYMAAQGDFASLDQELLFSRLYLACGHELTHGFDTNGVNFDENGKANPNWWSETDHTAYNTRVDSVISFYQGKEVLPGSYCNGTVVISEACADCAGMRLVMDLAKKIQGFDYEKFFNDTARLFMSTTTAALYLSFFAPDVHPYGRVRCNCLVGAADEFYTTFNIVEGEGMYTAPENRPNVW